MKLCSCCGYKTDATCRFCPECGSPFDEVAGTIADSAGTAGGEAGTTASPGMINPMLQPAGDKSPYCGTFAGLMGLRTGVYPGTGKEADPGAWYFSYSTSGMMYNGGVTYKAWEEDGVAKVSVRRCGVAPEAAPVYDADLSFLQKLEDSLNMADADAWDGFSESAKDVMDGESFSFSFKDGKGRRIGAHGYMAWPKNFGVASRIWYEMFDGLYEQHNPNYYRRLTKYIEDEVLKDVPKSRQGDSAVPLIGYGSKGEIHYGEWTIPDGWQRVSIGDFATCDPKSAPAADGIVVSIKKEQRDDYPGEKDVFFHVDFYRMDKDGARFLDDWEPINNLIVSPRGEASIFTKRKDYKMYVGFFIESSFDYGNVGRRFTLTVLEFADGTWKKLDSITAEIPGPETRYSDEDIEKLAALAERIGMTERAAKWREDPSYLYFTYADKHDICLVRWRSRQDDALPAKVRALPDGTPLPEYEVKVETAVY